VSSTLGDITTLPVKIWADIYMLPQKMDRFDPGKNVKNRDLGISEISNIDEVDGIYLASPRGLRWGKTEPQDYTLMFCSANVPSIPYAIIFGIVVLHF